MNRALLPSIFISVLMRFFPDLVRCMPVAENSPRTLIRWAEKELLNLLTGRYRSTADKLSMIADSVQFIRLEVEE